MKTSVIAAFGAMIILGACTSPRTDVSGRWSRPSEEPGLFLAGTENLTFAPDSTFSLVQDMRFEHADTALACNLQMRITVDGSWVQTPGGDVVITYSPETVRCDTVPGTFSLAAVRPDAVITDSIAEAMRTSLTDGVARYYTSGFAAINSMGGMTLASPAIINGELFATISGQPVSWQPAK